MQSVRGKRGGFSHDLGVEYKDVQLAEGKDFKSLIQASIINGLNLPETTEVPQPHIDYLHSILQEVFDLSTELGAFQLDQNIKNMIRKGQICLDAKGEVDISKLPDKLEFIEVPVESQTLATSEALLKREASVVSGMVYQMLEQEYSFAARRNFQKMIELHRSSEKSITDDVKEILSMMNESLGINLNEQSLPILSEAIFLHCRANIQQIGFAESFSVYVKENSRGIYDDCIARVTAKIGNVVKEPTRERLDSFDSGVGDMDQEGERSKYQPISEEEMRKAQEVLSINPKIHAILNSVLESFTGEKEILEIGSKDLKHLAISCSNEFQDAEIANMGGEEVVESYIKQGMIAVVFQDKSLSDNVRLKAAREGLVSMAEQFGQELDQGVLAQAELESFVLIFTEMDVCMNPGQPENLNYLLAIKDPELLQDVIVEYKATGSGEGISEFMKQNEELSQRIDADKKIARDAPDKKAKKDVFDKAVGIGAEMRASMDNAQVDNKKELMKQVRMDVDKVVAHKSMGGTEAAVERDKGRYKAGGHVKKR